MLKSNSRISLIFLKKKIKNKNIFLKNIIKKSIYCNYEIKSTIRYYSKMLIRNSNTLKKKCLFNYNTKYVNKKSKLSRFTIHKLSFLNLNHNYKIYEK